MPSCPQHRAPSPAFLLPAPAIFIGLQPGFRDTPPIELYNLLAPVGVHPRGSTVSRQTLLRHGYKLPPRPFAHPTDFALSA